MVSNDALTQLKDIHLPPDIGWWPLALGWYVLLFLSMLILGGFTRWWLKKRRNAIAKKQALALLDLYIAQYESTQDVQWACAQVTELLKRVALVYYPREQVAGLYGDEWLNFLTKTSKAIDFAPVKTMLIDLPFKPSEAQDIKPLMICAQKWIQQRGEPCLN